MKNLSKILFLCGIIIFTTFSCEEEDKETGACGIENPQENIEWLKYILDRRFCTEVYQYKYKGQEFISISDCPTGMDALEVIYTCEGEKYCEIGGFAGFNTCPEDWNEAEKNLIFKKDE